MKRHWHVMALFSVAGTLSATTGVLAQVEVLITKQRVEPAKKAEVKKAAGPVIAKKVFPPVAAPLDPLSISRPEVLRLLLKRPPPPAAVAPIAVAPVRMIMRLGMVGAEADLDQQIEQFTTQFRWAMHAEYRLIRQVCELNEEQRFAIAKDGELALREAATKCADVQNKMQNGGWTWGELQPNARLMIEEGFAKSLKSHLSPDQFAHYAAELTAKQTDRNHMAALRLVAKLDRGLLLSTDQREKILQSLLDKMKDPWLTSQDFFLNGDQWAPKFPVDLVTPFLNLAQKKVFAAIQANSNGYSWGNFGIVQNMIQDDPSAQEPEFVAARAQVDEERRSAKEVAKAKAKEVKAK